MHVKIPSAKAVQRLRAHVRNGERLPAEIDVITDTRVLTRGQTYLALRGERFDGHAFIGDALLGGASATIVADAAAVPPDAPALIVEDTLAALMELAALAREGFAGTVIAITGSAGKTTTKDFIAQLLEGAFPGRVHATPQNENNEIGVSKVLLALEAHERFAVIEMGARHYRDIAPLVRIAQPHVAVLTNIGEAHLEIMGSRERLADTKWEIFSGKALPVLNIDDGTSMARVRALERRPHFFGVRPRGAALPLERSVRAVLAREDRSLEVLDDAVTSGAHRLGAVPAAIAGRHNVGNAAAAVAAVLAAGIVLEVVREQLALLRLPHGRYERITLPRFASLIYDAYNASPDGMLATLETFALEPASRRIAVLGSMAELGEGAQRLHRTVGAAAAQASLDVVLIGGDHADDLEAGLRAQAFPAERIVHFDSNHAAAQWLAVHARPDDVVLLKGARRYKLEEIVEELRASRDVNGGRHV